MMIREFISLSIFLAFVLAVYIKEGQLIFKLILYKLRHKQGPSGFQGKPAVVIHVLALIGILCFLYGFFIEPFWIEVKKVEIETAKLSGTSLRIVQISDLHTDPNGVNERKMVDIVNTLNPDVIVFTGDTANFPKTLPIFREALTNLKAGMGKFAVTGNCDYWFFRGMDLFGGTGFRELDADTVKLSKAGQEFFISGLDFEHGNKWHEALKKVPAGYYSIFLYHKPDLIEDLRGSNVDLYLAGHTHGGQIALPFYGAIVTFSKYGKRYESGEYKVGNIILYVNRGLGTESLRVRFLVRPEITVFDIKPARSGAKR